MSIWKKITVALLITFSTGFLSTFSTVVIAAESKEGSRRATALTLKYIEGGMQATESGQTPKEIKAYYFKARQMAKDINGESVALLLQEGNDALLDVRRALKPDQNLNIDMDKVMATWEAALVYFKKIEKRQH